MRHWFPGSASVPSKHVITNILGRSVSTDRPKYFPAPEWVSSSELPTPRLSSSPGCACDINRRGCSWDQVHFLHVSNMRHRNKNKTTFLFVFCVNNYLWSHPRLFAPINAFYTIITMIIVFRLKKNVHIHFMCSIIYYYAYVLYLTMKLYLLTHRYSLHRGGSVA